MSLQGRELAQAASNLKKLDRGMEVVTWRGVERDRDVKRDREEREVLGKASAHARLKRRDLAILGWGRHGYWTK